MEEHNQQQQLNPIAITHLLQHTLRSLCINENSQWVYAVFWRILPRNYPPPKWDIQGGIYDRTRGNRRNWILVWEDGFCNFGAPSIEPESSDGGDCRNHQAQVTMKGLQPEIFFKMSHEIYNYGEGVIGNVAADHSHKWVFKDPDQEQEVNLLSSWNNPADSHPRTWEAQFQSGIKTIALIAVREGVIQLGAVNKVAEDLNYIVLLRKKFAYLESIPGVLLPHPSSASIPIPLPLPDHHWPPPPPPPPPIELYDHHHHYLNDHHQHHQPMRNITPSMSSLEALLSKLPSVGPAVSTEGPASSSIRYYEMPMVMSAPVSQRPLAAKEKMEEEKEYGSSSMSTSYYVNVSSSSSKPDHDQAF